ncbi:MAG: hypothetical protein HOO96_07505 [Polyangiaceae bacterium]|nr:hypothetical protein [Polyangiaceae bacterium]
MRFRVVIVLGGLVAACGIELSGGTPDTPDAGSSSSGGRVDASVAEASIDAQPTQDAEPSDAGADVDPRPGACAAATDLTDPDFETEAKWEKRDRASGQGNAGARYMRLTEENNSQAGSVWWKQYATVFSGFDATLKFTILDAKDVPAADGVAFAWVGNGASNTAPSGGDNGGNMGVCNGGDRNVGGYAVLVDTQGGDRGIRFVNAKDCSPIMEGGKPVVAPLPLVTNGLPHTLEVIYRATPGVVVAFLDGAFLWKATAPAAPTGNVYFGASGATGGQASEHQVQKLAVSLCN